jgi:hypothetical protein
MHSLSPVYLGVSACQPLCLSASFRTLTRLEARKLRRADSVTPGCRAGAQADRDCTERLVITAQEFENVRTRSTQFIVRPGHELPEIETVITRAPLYLLVEKTGEVVTEHLEDD